MTVGSPCLPPSRAVSVSSLGRPIYDVDLSDREVNKDPYPHLKAMREMAAVVYNPPSGWWMATSFDYAKAVLGGEEQFGPPVELFDNLFGARVFEGMEQPAHDEVRGIWKPHFRRAALGEYAAAVAATTDELLDAVMPRLRDGDVVDIVPDVLMPLPAYVIALIIGAPRKDFALFDGWNRDISGVLAARINDDSVRARGLRERAAAANAAMRDYFAQPIARRRAVSSTEDLVGVMANTDIGDLDEEQRRAHLVQLLWAGSDTTYKLFGNTMVTLARCPDQRRAIAADRSLVPQAIEESLRYESVSGTMLRIARDDVMVGDVEVPAGEIVAGYVAAANRDPKRWENPDVYDVHRPPRAHLGFGTGIHSCLGVQLARLEGRIWLNKVLDRMPDWDLASDDIDYGVNTIARGPTGVPIALA